MTYQINHFINGKLTTGKKDKRVELIDPVTGKVQGDVAYANADDVADAVLAAQKAFPAWSQQTAIARADVIFRFKALVESHIDVLAALITREHGKTLPDAKGSVQRGLEVVKFACGIANHLKGDYSTTVGTGVDCYSLRQALGVCVGITPFNFPAMIGLWMFPIAVACGNTFIWKPSEKDPSVGLRLVELFHEAGGPPGVLNLINGDKDVVDALLDNADVKAVSFVGSTNVAQHVYETAMTNGKRVQAFGGAKNHAVIMPDANLDQAADAIMGAAYGSAGERCMAISAVVVVGDETGDAFIQKLKDRIPQLKIGAGVDEVDMGPLVTREHYARVKSYIDLGVEEGASLVADGRDFKPDQFPDGNFMGASLFDHVTPAMRIYQEEIFGPVLSVLRVDDFSAALKLVNEHAYGNGTAIFTDDPDVAREFTNRVQVGMVGINLPIPVPVAQHSFGGWKKSMFGDIHMHGREGVMFYTKLKTVTQRWPRVSHGPEYKMPS